MEIFFLFLFDQHFPVVFGLAPPGWPTLSKQRNRLQWQSQRFRPLPSHRMGSPQPCRALPGARRRGAAGPVATAVLQPRCPPTRAPTQVLH